MTRSNSSHGSPARDPQQPQHGPPTQDPQQLWHAFPTRDPPILGVLGIIRREDRLLLIQRSKHVRVPLAWCFPGGTIEPGESQEQALVREMHEELFVEVAPRRLLMTQTKHDGRLVLYCWSADITHGDPRPNPKEIAALRWLTPPEIHAQPGLLPGTTEIIEKLGE